MFIKNKKGFTLIEAIVVMSIIALLSSVIFSVLTSTKKRARDSQRMQNARQIALALEQYEQSNNSYKVIGSGYLGEGGGYITKGSESSGYTVSILSALKAAGYVSSQNLKDPVFGTDNYYLGICASTSAYNVFIKLESDDITSASSTIDGACGGVEAQALGFTYVASTVGGSGGGAYAGDGSTPQEEEGGGSGYVAATGATESTFNPGTGVDISIMYTLIQPDGKILVAGGFTTYAGTAMSRLVRINQDGSKDGTFSIGTGANSYIYSLSLQSDGKIIATGQFTSFNGYSRNRIVRLNSNGSVDTTFNVGTGPDNWIRSSYIFPSGKIMVAGYFTSINGFAYNRVARLNSDGTVDTSFLGGAGVSGALNTVVVQPDGKILVGGNFTSCNSTTRNYICRLNEDGTLDTSFSPPTGLNGWPYAILPQVDGKILVGGSFTTCNGSACGNIIRLNSNGTTDTTFVSSVGANGYVYTINPEQDGKFTIGGNFTTYNGTSRGYIARISDTGALDTTFSPAGGANSTIHSIRTLSGGNLIVSGNFTTFNGSPINRIVRIE